MMAAVAWPDLSGAAALGVWRLARGAGTVDPDTADSPGGAFLRSVAEEVCERVAWCVEQGDCASDEVLADLAHEVADGAASVEGAATVAGHEAWSIFVDLAAWRIDTTDYGPPVADDLTGTVARCALYVIARDLAGWLLSNADEIGGGV